MNATQKYQALIVDDEPAVRRLLARALADEGFHCDLAADGSEATTLIADHRYHLVLTDLKMPRLHGHALAMEVLALEERPAIVVHTGVIEPLLARDLLVRGVDDVVFKPADTKTLAIKSRLLVERRFPQQPTGKEPAQQASRSTGGPQVGQEVPLDDPPVPMSEMEERFQSLSQALPISQAALDVYQMTVGADWTVGQVAAATQRDAALSIEVLRLANSAFYNPSGVPIVQLDRAVVHIGQKRIGELALAIGVLSAFAPKLLPWMDLGLAWKRSLAGGVIAEALDSQGGRESDPGTLLGAIMVPLGRVAMATLFPERYSRIVAHCRASGAALCEYEATHFPLDSGAVLARLLEAWGVPKTIYLPLSGFRDTERNGLPEEIQCKADRIKLSAALANLAVGRWEPWDQITLPSSRLISRLGIENPAALLNEARTDLERLASFQVHSKGVRSAAAPSACLRRMKVCTIENDPCNTMDIWLKSMQLEPEPCRPEELATVDEAVLVQCRGASPKRMAELLPQCSRPDHLFVVTAGQEELAGADRRVIGLPISYARFRDACLQTGC